MKSTFSFPQTRLRRLRQNQTVRKIFEETTLSPRHLILPLFVREGKNLRRPIASMPGQFQLSIDEMLGEVQDAWSLGIPAVILFGIPEKKDEKGTGAYSKDGIIQKATRSLKSKIPDLVVIADTCFCEYTNHGHCGIVRKNGSNYILDNDATLKLLAKTAISQAEAGADMIAPSGMMDGMVKTIRGALEEGGFHDTIILSYAVKYASAFYAPFRQAAEGAPQFGDRQSYQMNPANALEALREAEMDLSEGADILMVKPALPYLDILSRIKERFPVPVAAFNVSGEYSMVKAAAKNGWLDEAKVAREILQGIKRAGADMILTYHAKEVAKLLQ